MHSVFMPTREIKILCFVKITKSENYNVNNKFTMTDKIRSHEF